MKQIILLKILKTLNSTPNLKKKLLVAAGVGTVFLTVGLIFTVWAGIAAVRALSNQAQSLDVGAKMAAIESNLSAFSLPKLNNCWQGAQGLMAVHPWLSQPVVTNLNILRAACLDDKPAECEGHQCKKQKIKVNTANREII